MQRISISLMGALLGISLVTPAVGETDAKVAITRAERCSNLSRQVDEALETHATATQVTAANALQVYPAAIGVLAVAGLLDVGENSAFGWIAAVIAMRASDRPAPE